MYPKQRGDPQRLKRHNPPADDIPSRVSVPISPRTPFDDRIANLVASFEERLEKFKKYIAELEGRIEELSAGDSRTRASFDEFLEVGELTGMIRTTPDPGEVVQLLVQLLAKFIEYEAIGVFLFDEKRSRLQAIGAVPEKLARAAGIQYQEGVVDWVISENRPVIVPWIPGAKEPEGSARGHLVIVPMIVGDYPIGVTCISTPRRPADFSARDLRLLSFAVSHAAVAVQNALQAREISSTRDFLSNLLDNAGDIIFSLDHSGRFNFVNPRIEELGYRKEDLLDKHFRTVFPQKEAEMRISSTLRRGVKQVFELTLTGAGGLSQRYTLNLVPLKSTDGGRDGALGMMHNITELHRLQKKLLESERLAAYTQTVITLNHEINNPLTTVMGNVYLLEKETGKKKDKNLAKRLKIIQDNCQRIQRVIQKMERINELKTVTYLGDTKMVDLGRGETDDQDD